jgi:hypothetical protein
MLRLWASLTISSIGGIHPVMFEAAVMASNRGFECVSSSAATSLAAKIPSSRHST